MAVRFPINHEALGDTAFSSSSPPAPIFDVDSLNATLELAAQGSSLDSSLSSEGSAHPRFFPDPEDEWNSWQLNFSQLSVLCSKIASYIHRPSSRLEIPASSPRSTFARLWAGLQACESSFSPKTSPPRSILMKHYFLHSMIILLHRTRLTMDPAGHFIPVTTYAEESLNQVRTSASLIVQAINRDDMASVRTEPGIAFCAHTASLILLEIIINPYVSSSEKAQALQNISTCMTAMQEVARHWQVGNMYAAALNEAYRRSLPGHPPPSPSWPSPMDDCSHDHSSLPLSDQLSGDGTMMIVGASHWSLKKEKGGPDPLIDEKATRDRGSPEAPQDQRNENSQTEPRRANTNRRSKQEIEDELLMEVLDSTFLYP
ncbi:hypothetical protein BJ684DRAFT_21790 [Piptocephalis cylindrospora]|uniref:Transcription factor domain-containing protein n=1 Tax=Piptocephalis cylindrospora TaxID=1907219 RepID=A0A4P9XYV8_9FUNG|nr:hypothetical protein BJ684DRAFT_21790 [Piptocephalis cylindrospora]|eukprot:RKP11633.1 hypothetical protein BJ684DRAFT_21790 [Piptocephalis cylindrospora]